MIVVDEIISDCGKELDTTRNLDNPVTMAQLVAEA
jgi:hypothetical protein